MQAFIAWLKSKNWTAHTIALIGVTVVGIVAADPQAQQFLKNLFQNHPDIATEIIAFCVIVAKYTHSSSAAGKVAVAQQILASANPPSAEAVKAATVSPAPNLSSKVPLILLALMLMPFSSACKGPTVQQPLAPGYANSADQAMGQTLYAARGFYMRLYSNPSLSAAEKAALNDLGTALNVADAVYVSYHNGTATEAQAQAATDAVTAKQTAVQSLIPGVK